MPTSALTIGVHGAGLARAQAESVAQALRRAGARFPVHLEILAENETSVSTLHDDHIAESRSTMRRLHRLLIDGEIDVVIHSGFDLRGEIPEGLRIGAVLTRANPHDVLLAPHAPGLDELAEGVTVGVVHLRARAQLLDYRPDLHYELIAGDAGAWLTALIDGRVEALVAPSAAIELLSLQASVVEIFPPELLVPAPGAGILLCLCRDDDVRTARRLRPLHHAAAGSEYTAECAFMESLGGAWENAIAVLARHEDDHLDLVAMVARPDGSRVLRERHVAAADDPCVAGAELAALLLDAGADRLVDPSREDATPGADVAGHLPAPDPVDGELD